VKRQAHIFYEIVPLAVFFASVYLLGAGRADGQVNVWGDNSYGQTNVPANATNVIALAAGDYHCLALRTDGTVVAWGEDSSGQTDIPPNLTNVVSIAAGSSHSLGLFLLMLAAVAKECVRCWPERKHDPFFAGLMVGAILHLWPLAPSTSFLSAWASPSFWLVFGAMLAYTATGQIPPKIGDDLHDN
jgi:hypothetical protein